MVVKLDAQVKRKLLKEFEPGKRIGRRVNSHISMIAMSYLLKYTQAWPLLRNSEGKGVHLVWPFHCYYPL